MNKQSLAYLLTLMVALSGMTYYTFNNHTTFIKDAEESDIYSKWIAWQTQFNKQYSSEEIPMRFSVFSKNYKFIQEFNQDKARSFTVGLNQFADLTNEEFVTLKTKRQIIPRENEEETISTVTTIPTSIDWETNALQPIKNQGQCGNCMVFSLTESLEGLYYIIHGKKLGLSVQQLLDCAAPDGSGCNGGSLSPADYYAYIEKYGIESESDYPFTGQSQKCQYDAKKVVMKISGYTQVKQNSSEAMLQAVAKQPIQAAIEADQTSFQFYSSGVFDDVSCGTNLDHNIVVAGYQTGGPNWGNNGNIWIGFDPKKTNDAGICGLNLDASYPNK